MNELAQHITNKYSVGGNPINMNSSRSKGGSSKDSNENFVKIIDRNFDLGERPVDSPIYHNQQAKSSRGITAELINQSPLFQL